MPPPACCCLPPPAPHVMPLISLQGYWNGAAALSVHNLICKHTSPSHPTPPPFPHLSCPPAAPCSAWQASKVRELPQEFSSASFVAPGHPAMGYVAICVVARDAHADMLEWINHHVRWAVLPARLPVSLWACIYRPAGLPVCGVHPSSAPCSRMSACRPETSSVMCV